MRAPLLLAFIICAAPACTTTQTIPTTELKNLSCGGQRDPVVLAASDGSSVRIDPNTAIRFVTTNKGATDWTEARDLEVGEHGVLIRDDDRGVMALDWSEIRAIHARNVSGSKSLALVIGSAAVVAAIVAARDTAKWSAPVVDVTARVAVYAAWTRNPRLSWSEGRPKNVVAEAPPSVDTRTLFEGPVRRRSNVELVPALSVYGRFGTDLSYSDPLRYGVTASVVARIEEMIELGFGVSRAHALRIVGENSMREAQLTGFFRGGATFYLDDAHRIGIPLLLDVGFGANIETQLHFQAGARIRVFDTWTFGLYPATAMYTRYRDRAAYSDPRWTVPTLLETSFAF